MGHLFPEWPQTCGFHLQPKGVSQSLAACKVWAAPNSSPLPTPPPWGLLADTVYPQGRPTPEGTHPHHPELQTQAPSGFSRWNVGVMGVTQCRVPARSREQGSFLC